MAAEPPVLLRPEHVPDLYGFSRRQVRRWIAEGRIARVKPSGPTGPVYVKRADLDALIEQSTIPAGKRTKVKKRRSPKR